MDGIWAGQGASEPIRQARLTRHRILTVNVSPIGVKNNRDASSYASANPNNLSSENKESGPHFVLSPETSDGRPTLGFEFCLLTIGMNAGQGTIALPALGGFTVTVWVLITATQLTDGTLQPAWASLDPVTGVELNEMFHSFDLNTSALRFQIGNVQEIGSITIALAEI